jgi:hypothetical protein
MSRDESNNIADLHTQDFGDETYRAETIWKTLELIKE